MNTPTTSPRPQRRGSAMQSCGVSRGRLAPKRGLRVCRSFECHTCWPVVEASPSPFAARDTIVSTGPVAAWAIRAGRGYWRANFVHSGSASEPNPSFHGESPEGDDPLARVWAGARPSVSSGEPRARSARNFSPRGQPPAGNVECRATDLRPGGCPLAELSWPAAWALTAGGVGVGGVDQGLATLVAVCPA